MARYFGLLTHKASPPPSPRRGMKLKIHKGPRICFFFLASLKRRTQEEPRGAWEGCGVDGWMDGCPRPKQRRL